MQPQVRFHKVLLSVPRYLLQSVAHTKTPQCFKVSNRYIDNQVYTAYIDWRSNTPL